MVIEAITAKVREQRRKAEDDVKRKQRRESHRELRGKKPGMPGLAGT